jgi:dUTP pyrophosphatase
LTSRALLPQKGHPTDAGFDLAIPEDCTLGPQKRLVIDLEIALQIPDGWYGQIFGRSSVFQRGLFVNPGVIDAGYRGAVQLLVENHLHSTQHLQRGDRLAQLLFLPVPAVTLKRVASEALNRTLRGTGGVGSTGR